MQITSPPFWLMMVSRMTAVLPVWRSPMINSRWPRPIGIIASMALMPVCSGSRTGWRSSTPGAMRSSGLRCFVAIGPFAVERHAQRIDHAANQRFAHRHGHDRVRALDGVAFLQLAVYSPSSTAPTSSSSRFSAMPKTSCGNASISPAMTFSRP